jgi:hypothetical protein
VLLPLPLLLLLNPMKCDVIDLLGLGLFPLDRCRKFIHQEEDKATKKEARFLKKQKKEAKKQQKRRGHGPL